MKGGWVVQEAIQHRIFPLYPRPSRSTPSPGEGGGLSVPNQLLWRAQNVSISGQFYLTNFCYLIQKLLLRVEVQRYPNGNPVPKAYTADCTALFYRYIVLERHQHLRRGQIFLSIWACLSLWGMLECPPSSEPTYLWGWWSLNWHSHFADFTK